MKNRNILISVFFLIVSGLMVYFTIFRERMSSVSGDVQAESTPEEAYEYKPLTPEELEGMTPEEIQRHSEARQINLTRHLMKVSNAPIDFYGILLDQNDDPIEGARIAYKIKHMIELAPGKTQEIFKKGELSTDREGKFQIEGEHGSILGFDDVEKDGYMTLRRDKRSGSAGYIYWGNSQHDFKSNPNEPEVFRLWKKAGAAELIRKGYNLWIPYDGTSMNIDLMKGVVKEGGDIRVTLLRNPLQVERGQRNYEWIFTLESLNGGGVVESNDMYMYLAPEEGYQSKLSFHMLANNPNWTRSRSLSLYVRIGDGDNAKYGRMNIEISTGSGREKDPLYISGIVINPSGSRNLEYDPNEQKAR